MSQCITTSPIDNGGNANLEQKYSGLLKDALRLARMSPKNPFPLYAAGKAYIALGNFKRAENQLRKAIKLDPSHWDSYRELGFLLLSVGRLDACRRLIDRLHRNISVFESECLCILFSALLLARQGQHGAAVTVLKENLLYCGNNSHALEVIRLSKPLAHDPARLWSLDIRGSIRFGKLVKLPACRIYNFHVIAASIEECIAHIEELFHLSQMKVMRSSLALPIDRSNVRYGVYAIRAIA